MLCTVGLSDFFFFVRLLSQPSKKEVKLEKKEGYIREKREIEIE